MIDTEEILKKIERLYEHTKGATVDIPLCLQARIMAQFARDYIAAASTLEREVPQHWLPILQLTGHAVELSLKACLASANSIPPRGHDLIKLYRQAEKLGFELDAPKFAAIVHLRHFYFKDLATGTMYKARYPAKKNEPVGGAVPSNSTFTSIVNALLDQATQRGAI
jgi:predicted lipase